MKQGWTYKKLGDVATIIHGKNQKEVLSDDGFYPIYGSGGSIMGYATDFLCEAGSTILGRKGSINNPQFIEQRFWNVDTAFGITPKDDNCSKFIYYFITSIDWSKKNTGTTLPSLTQQIVKDVIIPIPSPSEQQRIVARLDAAFAHIDELKVNSEKQLAEARNLFQKALAKAMKPKEGWRKYTLKDIVDGDCPISYGIVQQGDHKEGGIPVVRPVDLTSRYVTKDGLKCTEESISNSYKRTILRGDEILLSVRGTTGVLALASSELAGCNVNRGIVPLFFKQDINKDFVYFEMLSPNLQKMFADNTTGSTLKQINIKDLRLIELIIPSLSEQQRIVERLDALSAHVKELEEVLNKTITECDALKQSMLRKVFE